MILINHQIEYMIRYFFCPSPRAITFLCADFFKIFENRGILHKFHIFEFHCHWYLATAGSLRDLWGFIWIVTKSSNYIYFALIVKPLKRCNSIGGLAHDLFQDQRRIPPGSYDHLPVYRFNHFRFHDVRY